MYYKLIYYHMLYLFFKILKNLIFYKFNIINLIQPPHTSLNLYPMYIIILY